MSQGLSTLEQDFKCMEISHHITVDMAILWKCGRSLNSNNSTKQLVMTVSIGKTRRRLATAYVTK